MKSPLFPLRQGYYTALSGNLTLGGAVVKVASQFEACDNLPFVFIGEVNLLDLSTKDNYGSRASVLIDINGISRKDVEDLTNQVMGLVLKSHANQYVNVAPDFKVVTAKLESLTPLEEITQADKGYRYRILLRIENIIQEL